MTHQDGAPLTRRALRTQATAGAPSTAPEPRQDDAPRTDLDRPLTRRELRMAGTSRPVVSTDATGPSTPLPAPTPATGVGTGPTGAADRPLTRREIRLRERAPALADAPATARHDDGAEPVSASDVASACRPPFVASLVLPVTTATPSASGPAAPATAAPTRGHTAPPSRRDARPAGQTGPSSARSTTPRRLVAHVGRKPVAVVALSAGLLTVGVTQVHAEQGVVAQALAAAEATRAATERQQRADGAAADRLMAQAAAYAAGQRNQALAAAEAAVAAAHGAKEVAAPVLDPETVARLEQAATELAAMVEAAPAPVVPVASTPVEAPSEVPAEAPVDDTTASGADLLAEADASDRTDQPSRSVPAEGRAPLPGTPATGPAEGTAGEDTSEEDPSDEDPSDEDPAPTTGADAGADGSPDAGAADAPAAGPGAPGAAAAAPAAELVDALPDLDIEVSRRIREQADVVAALTAEVQGLAGAKLAEAAAAAAAAEEARLAAEAAQAAAAAELARKVAVAKDAGNGDIPTDVLCGVGFDEDVLLRCDAAAALEELNAAYRADFGRNLDVVSSYRSYSQQVAVKRTRGGLAAAPGTSNHGLGVAVDFGGFGGLGNFSTANYRWMRANGERFGWYHPRIMQPGGGGPQEPWHWEFGTDS